MRVLLMVSNSNMAIRELYTVVLRERFPGWGLSNMSGKPFSPAYIVKSFDVLVYELGKPDDPARYRALEAFLEEIKEVTSVRVVTHVEGPYRDGIVADLESRGVICAGTPFDAEAVAASLARTAPTPPAREPGDSAAKPPRGLRRFFHRQDRQGD